jgi:NAD+ kinase
VPSMGALVVTPISPHTLAVRPVIVPGEAEITVEIASRMGGILITVDGQAGARLGAGDRVRVRRSPHPVRTLRLPEITFFSVLRQKLRWGDVRPSGA